LQIICGKFANRRYHFFNDTLLARSWAKCAKHRLSKVGCLSTGAFRPVRPSIGCILRALGPPSWERPRKPGDLCSCNRATLLLVNALDLSSVDPSQPIVSGHEIKHRIQSSPRGDRSRSFEPKVISGTPRLKGDRKTVD